MGLFGRTGVYDGRDTFFEGVQAGQLDHGIWELIPLGESVREEALLDVVSLIEWHVVTSHGTKVLNAETEHTIY